MDKTKQGSIAFMGWKFDTRVIQRNINEGVMTAAEYNTFVEKLPDVSAKAEPVRTSLTGGNGDDADLDDDNDQD
jgi:hypothetical protein